MVFVNFFNKSKLTSFHEFKWWVPQVRGLGLEEPGSQERPWGAQGSGLPRDLVVLVVGWGLVQGLQGGQGGLGKGSGEGQESVRIFSWL